VREVNHQQPSVGHLAPRPLANGVPGGCRTPGNAEIGRTITLTRPLSEAQWRKIRTFVGGTNRDDLRLRFGQPLDFADDAILRRFFGVGGACSEQIWALDDAGDISGILHRVRTSPAAAEIALIVRSNLKRRGVGEALLRTALARAAAQNVTILRAYVLGENSAMLRLARKVGFVAKGRTGFSVELEFNLQPVTRGVRPEGPEATSPAQSYIGILPAWCRDWVPGFGCQGCAASRQI
jgi:GNAT superfamily N-acetyltransferase